MLEKAHNYHQYKVKLLQLYIWHLLNSGSLTIRPKSASFVLFYFFFPSSSVQFSSVAQSYPTLRPHEPQQARPPCPSPTAGVHPNSCPLRRWCHPAISYSVVPFSTCPQFFPASESFQMSQLFTLGGQSIGVSASTSVLPMNIQDWYNECVNTVWIVISIKHFEIVYIFAV